MTLEDYGQLGPLVMSRGEFSIFFWVKASSSMIDFEVMSLSQPLIQNVLPMFAVGFEMTGQAHVLKCYWAQQQDMFDTLDLNLS
jgi:hypothetical protein